MVLAPMTSIPRIGRRDVFLGSLLFFTIFNSGSAAVRNLPGFLVLRLLAGIAGSPAISTVGAASSDLYSPLYAAYALALWAIFGVNGPVLGE